MANNNPQAVAPRRPKEWVGIGSFQRQEEIGRGSFATVYKAIHTVRHIDKMTDEEERLTASQDAQGEQSVVAIKSVNLSKLNKKLKDNLTSEISILKGLHHPHIVALIDCKDTGSYIHLVMEYVALGDLSYFIKKRDLIKNSELVGNMMEKYPNPRDAGLHEVVVRHFLQQLASALQFLRARNLIHRDVKPQNLLLNPSPDYFRTHRPPVMPYCASDDALNPICGIRSLPMLKIADFGFARSLPSTSLAETLCGSPLYMAPEILRYEKYDAKADLWSVGTVLYEMVTSRPPFRAANHVELLRKIEKGEDRIKFGDQVAVSRELKTLIRALLKRDPQQRLSFPDFFANGIITGPIPGLAAEDLPRQPDAEPDAAAVSGARRPSKPELVDASRPGKIRELESPYTQPLEPPAEDTIATRRPSIGHRRLSSIQREAGIIGYDKPSSRAVDILQPTSPGTRPGLLSHATAPGRQELLHKSSPPSATAMVRQTSVDKQTRPLSSLREHVQTNSQQPGLRSREDTERERTAQDIAFERDYVLVEKRAVEVNALADELDASPRFTRPSFQSGNTTTNPAAGMVRRATTQGQPTSTTGAQPTTSRAVQIASGRRNDPSHGRQNSYDRRYGPGPSSATSAISKALNMASGRLFGVGFSPPVNLRPGGRSPPVGYSPYPVYPGAQSSLVVVGEAARPAATDEDTRFIQNVEEIATRSDVIYGFAEVKYKQLTPAIPSARQSGDAPNSLGDDLTVEAVVMVSEEALVLYVKALSLLAKAMDIAARWWARKNRADESGGKGTSLSSANGQRMNNVVQWTRARFNEVLEKADLVRLKLIDGQKRLPDDHPCHPNNISAATASSTGTGFSAEQVVVSSGVTAEKLMYDRAVEMSRAAAINELTGEDLIGCEISYVTAIRMLEAVLETDEDGQLRKSIGTGEKVGKEEDDDGAPVNGLEVEDRRAVKNLVTGIRGRLDALRRKLQIIQKRASAPAISSPTRASPPLPYRTNSPTTATATPPR